VGLVTTDAGGPEAPEPERQLEREKQAAAEAAAGLVKNHMTVGLGTGSTVAYLLPALARRSLSARYVVTSPRTGRAARELGLPVDAFETQRELDLVIDGADQVAPDGWLVKGGGGAHTREKIVATAAERFVVIVDSSKMVSSLGPPVPLELLEFGLASTIRQLGPVTQRGVPRSPDGGIIADYRGPIGDPATLAARLSATPGVVEHGLFPRDLVSLVVIGRRGSVEWSEVDQRSR
jgi:ribose 5-phosphate isomerase A